MKRMLGFALFCFAMGMLVMIVIHNRFCGFVLGAEGVFVGSGIFKSGNPAKRAAAIVQAVTNYNDAKLIAELSEDLGEAMVGINEDEIQLLMAERGK